MSGQQRDRNEFINEILKSIEKILGENYSIDYSSQEGAFYIYPLGNTWLYNLGIDSIRIRDLPFRNTPVSLRYSTEYTMEGDMFFEAISLSGLIKELSEKYGATISFSNVSVADYDEGIEQKVAISAYIGIPYWKFINLIENGKLKSYLENIVGDIKKKLKKILKNSSVYKKVEDLFT